MVQKLLLPLFWFPLTLVLLILNLSLLVSIAHKTEVSKSPTNLAHIGVSTSGTEQVLGATIQAGDARSLLLYNFLSKNESPLAKFSDYIIDRAEQYHIDYRLVPAIAMCESTGGKRIPSKNSFNAWGISVETGQITGKNFDNWTHAIDWVSKYLHEKYFAKGITSLVDIGAIYAPPSVANGNSWANCVEFFMGEIQ